MAKVVITITDQDEEGNVQVSADFDPVIMSTNPEDLSPAQYMALAAISSIHNGEELSATTRTLQ